MENEAHGETIAESGALSLRSMTDGSREASGEWLDGPEGGTSAQTLLQAQGKTLRSHCKGRRSVKSGRVEAGNN